MRTLYFVFWNDADCRLRNTIQYLPNLSAQVKLPLCHRYCYNQAMRKRMHPDKQKNVVPLNRSMWEVLRLYLFELWLLVWVGE